MSATRVTRSRGRQMAIAFLVCASLLASRAEAWVPGADDLAGLLAERNRGAQRAQALRLAVVVKDGAGDAVARGVATLENGGAARLALTYRGGSDEVQERSGAGYRVDPPQPAGEFYPLLPPLAFLQASSPERILGLLRGLGGDPTEVGLGIDGNRDCWVLGGRAPGDFEAHRQPSLWIGIESRELVRIDAGDEVAYRVGPIAAFGEIRLPKWFEVRPRGAESLRLEFEALATPD